MSRFTTLFIDESRHRSQLVGTLPRDHLHQNRRAQTARFLHRCHSCRRAAAVNVHWNRPVPIRLDRGEHRHTIRARRNAAPVLEDQHRYEQSLCSYLNDVSTHHIGGAKVTRTPDLLVAKAPPTPSGLVWHRADRCMRCMASAGVSGWEHTGGTRRRRGKLRPGTAGLTAIRAFSIESRTGPADSAGRGPDSSSALIHRGPLCCAAHVEVTEHESHKQLALLPPFRVVLSGVRPRFTSMLASPPSTRPRTAACTLRTSSTQR